MRLSRTRPIAYPAGPHAEPVEHRRGARLPARGRGLRRSLGVAGAEDAGRRRRRGLLPRGRRRRARREEPRRRPRGQRRRRIHEAGAPARPLRLQAARPRLERRRVHERRRLRAGRPLPRTRVRRSLEGSAAYAGHGLYDEHRLLERRREPLHVLPGPMRPRTARGQLRPSARTNESPRQTSRAPCVTS